MSWNNWIDLRENISHVKYSQEISTRTQELLAAGFTQEWIDRVSSEANNITLWKTPWEKIEELKILGFTNPIKLITSLPAILGLSIEDNIKPKIDELKTLGFTNPIKLITSSPAILGYSIEDNIKPKIDELKTLGFTNPIKLITSSPAILGLSIEDNIKPKIDELKTLEFTNPIKLITSLPAILGLSIEDNIKPKIDELKTLGFTNPIKLITSSPAILGYSIEDNIKPKIDELKTLGFTNPIKLITSLPAILGLSIEDNIKPKVRLAKKIIWDDDLAINILESAPEIIGTKIDKTWTILRWLKILWLLNQKIIPYYKNINIKELESFIVAVDALRNKKDVTISQLRKEIAKYKKMWDKKKRKEVIVWEDLKRKNERKAWENLSPEEKLLHRYARGYAPKKK